MKKNVIPKVVLVAGIAIFVSIFLFARAVISISFFTVIVLYFLNRDFSLDRSRLKYYMPLFFLMLAGIIITASYIYAFFIKDQTVPISQVISYSNPAVIVLYAFSLSYFLSKNKQLSNYLLWSYLTVAILFSLVCFFKFLYDPNIDLLGIYGNFGVGSNVQGVIAFTFPFVSVCLINLAIKAKKISSKTLLACSALLVIFTDLFINTSKIGYIVEFLVLLYYGFIFIKTYSIRNNEFNIRKMLITAVLAFLALIIVFGMAFHKSRIFHDKSLDFVNSIERVVASKSYTKEERESLEQQSTGLRVIYYISSIEVFKKYPSVFFFGCSFTGNTSDINYCTESLIKNSEALQNNKMVIKNHPIEPHNGFITYIFMGGFFAALFLLMFFLNLLYITKYFSFEARFNLRVLILAYLIASCTGFYLTTQYEVTAFFTLLGIFLSKVD